MAEQCVFCREQPADSPEMAVHLLVDHLPEISRLPWVGSRMRRCWCGALVDGARDFALHLENRGGVQAHFLECQLGIYPPREEAT